MRLTDLYRHQAWADAEHWRAVLAHPAAVDDIPVRNRLHHIHQVQQAFLWTLRGARESEMKWTRPEEFPGLRGLPEVAQAYHAESVPYVEALDRSALDEMIRILWFKDPPLSITREEALLQCAMHSHYHRGQNATRLRELGATPPLTDFIYWLWKGKPAAAWT